MGGGGQREKLWAERAQEQQQISPVGDVSCIYTGSGVHPDLCECPSTLHG